MNSIEFLKKILPLAISINLFIILFIASVPVSAQEFPTKCNITHDNIKIDGKTCPKGEVEIEKEGTCCFMNTLLNVRDWLFYILLTIAAIFIIVAAYYFVTASGNPEQVTKAKHLVLYALIGVLVAFMALGLVSLIGTIAGWKTT